MAVVGARHPRRSPKTTLAVPRFILNVLKNTFLMNVLFNCDERTAEGLPNAMLLQTLRVETGR